MQCFLERFNFEVQPLEQFNFEMQPIASNVTSALLVKLPAFGGSRNERR